MKHITTLNLILTMTLFTACGGNNSSSSNSNINKDNQNEIQEIDNNKTGESPNSLESITSNTSEETNFVKISGTVPGTLIEAFCEDGTYTQVTSTQNGTNKHPFNLQVPKNINCKLVMTTNENSPTNRVISNIEFTNGEKVGTTIKLVNDLDLTYIPLSLSYADTNDSNGDHVVDNNLIVNVNINKTLITDSKVSDSNNNGIIDAYDDSDNNDIVNAYEDDDKDGIINLHDDKNNNKKPDYLDDDNNDGVINHNEDRDNNGKPDYIQDNDGDGKANNIDNDSDGNGIKDELEPNESNEHSSDVKDTNSNESDEHSSDIKDTNSNESDEHSSDIKDTNSNELDEHSSDKEDDDDFDESSEHNNGQNTTNTINTITSSQKTFNINVMPILKAKCKNCHGNNGRFKITTTDVTYNNIIALKNLTKASGEYILDKGSDTIRHGGGMVIKNSSNEYKTIKAWIDAGAKNN